VSNGAFEPPDAADVAADEVALAADEVSAAVLDHPDAGAFTPRLVEVREQLLGLLQDLRRPPPGPQGGPARRTPPEKLAMARQMLQGGLSVRHVSRLTGMTRETVRSLTNDAAPQTPPTNGKLVWPAGPLDQPARPARPRPLTRADQVEIRARVRSGEARVVVAGDYNVSRDTLAVVLHEEDDP
jgi:hypothetical protein